MLICGVDDAGRGSMIGPLVIAGISIEKSKIKKLQSLGVKDSKKLSPQIREKLYSQILKIISNYHICKISPCSIDKSVKNHLLNSLEAKYMAKIVSKLSPDVSYVDSCDVNPSRFGKLISELSEKSKIRSYHFADSRFTVVAAASIIAKVSRDREIKRISKQFPVGSGYPSDKKTTTFVKDFLFKNGALPPHVRKSWKPVQKLLEEKPII